MRSIAKFWVALIPFLLFLDACSGPASSSQDAQPHYPAHLYVLDDVSASSAMQGDDAVGNGVRRTVGEAVKALALGDSIMLLEVGSRSAERFASRAPIVTGPQLRQAAASRKVVAEMEDIAAAYRSNGGDVGTNLLLALQNLHPDCRSGRSTVMIVSDGVEGSEAYDAAAALNQRKPVELPPPASTFLRGCKVSFLGFGVSARRTGGGAILPETALEALRDGWRKWLLQAGVAPADIGFTSLI